MSLLLEAIKHSERSADDAARTAAQAAPEAPVSPVPDDVGDARQRAKARLLAPAAGPRRRLVLAVLGVFGVLAIAGVAALFAVDEATLAGWMGAPMPSPPPLASAAPPEPVAPIAPAATIPPNSPESPTSADGKPGEKAGEGSDEKPAAEPGAPTNSPGTANAAAPAVTPPTAAAAPAIPRPRETAADASVRQVRVTTVSIRPADAASAAPSARKEAARPKAPSPPPAEPEDHGARAYQAASAGDHESARNLYVKALKTDPLRRDALLGMARLAHNAGRFEEAARHFEAMLLLDARDADALAGLAFLRGASDPVGWESRLNAAAADRGENAQLFLALGWVLGEQRRWGEAAGAFSRAVALIPENGSAWFNLGVALERSGSLTAAVPAYSRAAQLPGETARAAAERIKRLAAASEEHGK